jgi:uncharacterized surface protein with fasciclin (FAS1) repeats
MQRRTSFVLSLTFVFALLFGAVALPQPAAAQSKPPTIVEIAAGNPNFTTLVAAVQAAGLVDLLNGNRQFTVFAPTNDAFAKLGLNAGNIGSLPKDQLTAILLYHVAPGERLADSVVNARQIRMMNKQFTQVTVNSSGAFINSSRIIATDIDASNGVIHVIDTVLLPK